MSLKSGLHNAVRKLTLYKLGCLPTAHCTLVLLVLASGIGLSGIQLLTCDSIGFGLGTGIGRNLKVISISHRHDIRNRSNLDLNKKTDFLIVFKIMIFFQS